MIVEVPQCQKTLGELEDGSFRRPTADGRFIRFEILILYAIWIEDLANDDTNGDIIERMTMASTVNRPARSIMNGRYLRDGLKMIPKATTREGRQLVQRGTHTVSSKLHLYQHMPRSIASNGSRDLLRLDACRRFASVSALSLTSKKRHGHKITMVTAYDFPSAVHVARAGIDVLLVGDSAAMVELGYETTQPMTLDHMIFHCQSVKRGVQHAGSPTPLLVGDLPFGTYEFEDTDIALRNAYRFVKEAGMDAVKLEVSDNQCIFSLNEPVPIQTLCFLPSMHREEVRRDQRRCKRLLRAEVSCVVVDIMLKMHGRLTYSLLLIVAVMGHVGLTPQAISVIGGFRAQGRTASRARNLLDEAMRLQDAGAFAIVLECVPGNVAKAITDTLEIPTIGIGAGSSTSGQVLVFHDMLGMLSHPHHEQFMPKFCKQYAQVGHAIQDGLKEFKADVESSIFPGEEYSPYKMSDKEKEAFDALLEKDEAERQRKHEEAAIKLTAADEYEQLHLYGNDATSQKK